MSKSTLAERFIVAQATLDAAQLEYVATRSAYFADRRSRAMRGETLEPLVCTDQVAWSTQLGREEIARANGQRSREAGLTAA